MDEGEIKISTKGVSESFSKVSGLVKNKKIVWSLVFIALLVFVVWGSAIRMQNVDALKDSTTGKYLPADPDSLYFLRIAEKLNSEGSLPEYDEFRKPYDIPYPKELLPISVVYIYKVAKIFDSEITLEYADVALFSIVFFVLGIISFFLFVYALTKSKVIALVSSIFLTVIPSYLFRTMPGVPDHEPLGMFSFFLAMCIYTIALKFLDKNEEIKGRFFKTIILSALVGFLTTITIASWGGIANFLFMIIPLSFGIFWLIKSQNLHENLSVKNKFITYLTFYWCWFIFTILSSSILGFTLKEVLGRAVLNSTSILTGFFLVFVLIDFFLLLRREKLSEKERRYRVLWSGLGTIIVGILLLFLVYGNLFTFFGDIISRLLHPFGVDRVSITVSENQQPYLNDWVGQTGKLFFWLFFSGLAFMGFVISESIQNRKDKFLFALVWLFFISGLLFSRISAGSTFNGTNLLSKLFYFGSGVLFVLYMALLYFKDKIDLNVENIIIFSWTIFMLIAGRGAVRTFFLITPFMCFSVGYLWVHLPKYFKGSKDDLLKMVLGIALVIVLVSSLFSLNGFVQASTEQAKGKGSIGGVQWQNAMKWVRENTLPESIFVHWWDYGYMVQYMGKRPTLADGGHFEGAYRDHMIGRYLLTNPNPESAMSFMKSNNVSYLLIDPTDIGKYPAYSSIGSGSEETENDRWSYLPPMIMDPRQTQETNNSEFRFYQGGANVDEDIIYTAGNESVFLPQGRSYIAGFILEIPKGNKDLVFNQPQAVFIYNQQQIKIPIRYIYSGGGIMDFESGLEAGVMLMPLVNPSGSNGQGQITPFDAAVYMSPKVFKGLFAQLYLMDDPFNKYPTVTIARSEPDPFIASLNIPREQLGDFVFFNGIRGPLKIWRTEYPNNILVKEEFTRQNGEYAEFDDLIVTA